MGKLLTLFQMGFQNKCSDFQKHNLHTSNNNKIAYKNDHEKYSSLIWLEEEILNYWPLPFVNIGLNKWELVASI